MAYHTGQEEFDEEQGKLWFVADCGERYEIIQGNSDINDGNFNTGEPCQECADAKARAEEG